MSAAEDDRDSALAAAESARTSATESAVASVRAASDARSATEDEKAAKDAIAEARKVAAEADAEAASAARAVADTARSDAGATGNNIAADTEGCIYSGNLDIIDTHYFIYNMTFMVSGCADLSGTYSGLATLEEEFSIEDHPHTHYRFMTFGVSDGEGKTINNRMTLGVYGI